MLAEQLRKVSAEKAGYEKRIRDYEASLPEAVKSKEGYEGLKAENVRLSGVLKKNEETLTGLQREREDLTKQIKVFADANKTTGELAGKLQESEKKKTEAEKRYAELTKKQGETEKRLAEIEQKRSETEIQARKAIADRAVIEGQLKEKEAALAALQKAQGEKEHQLADHSRALAQAKLSREELQKLKDEKEALQRQQTEAEKQKTVLAEQLRKVSAEKAGYEKRIRDYEASLPEAVKSKEGYEGLKAENVRLSGVLKKNEETLTGLQREREDLTKQIKVFAADRARADALLKERDNLVSVIAGLRQETDRFKSEVRSTDAAKEQSAALIKKYEEEKHFLQKQQSEAEKQKSGYEKRISELEIKLRDTDARKAEAEAQAKKSSGETIRNEALIKERDGLVAAIERIRQENTRLSREDRSSNAVLQQTTEALQKMKVERDQLRTQLTETRDSTQGTVQLQSRLRMAELQKSELEVQVRKAIEDRSVSEKKLLEKEALIARLEKLQSENRRLISDAGAGAETLKKLAESNRLLGILNDDYKALMLRHDELLRQRGQECLPRSSAAGSLSTYDAPAVKIGGRPYTRMQIVEESLISSRVLSSLKSGDVPWRRGNPYEDFIIEQVLHDKAGEGLGKELLGKLFKARQSEIDKMVHTFNFDAREKEYLIKYLTIKEFVGRKIREQYIDEAKVRNYYENNKRLYATAKTDQRVAALILPVTLATQLEGAVRMTEVQTEAAAGKSLQLLYQSGADGLLLKELYRAELPGWVQEKIEDLQDGQTSTVLSTDDQYMIYQAMPPESGFRNFDAVKDEIRNSLAASEVLGPWLSKIRKEAQEIR
ncbi:MAG: hypothetical protein C0402_00350 [Thermodesulfovibrio sp.]|nr:hypothetical protein [Thermodesulfovibrio sp.]